MPEKSRQEEFPSEQVSKNRLEVAGNNTEKVKLKKENMPTVEKN